MPLLPEHSAPQHERAPRPLPLFLELLREISLDDPELARELRQVYGHPDKVDLMVGMYAEKPPAGFGFSDTAFRVFILMASRRFRSDRYFTADFTPAVYTQPGMDWINDNSMQSVLLRHYPQLRPALASVPNAFTPWIQAVPA